MTTRIAITADIEGTFWWPIGEPYCIAQRQFDVTAHQRRCIGGDRGARGLSLRQAVESMCDAYGGDSASGVRLAYGMLWITRNGRTRAFALSMFPSIADMVSVHESEVPG